MFHPASPTPLVERIVAELSAAPPAIGVATYEEIRRNDENLRVGLREVRVPLATINVDVGLHGVGAVGRPRMDAERVVSVTLVDEKAYLLVLARRRGTGAAS